ncbi:hypothetical protein L3Q82_000567 [Scortum barcoo]|uniref:Uncharacterized protein n=1 Tax=Scortum barcoo TaxID=214431 RepID=A0ACB8WGM1_9TELE|nr:hypothetical protein L3Q82_000567 [Scortum barcoo]
MSLTITVMMGLLLILLCSGFFHFTFALNRLRSFSFTMLQTERDNAVEKCNQTNGSLVTLYDEEDAKFTAKFLNTETFWLGLHCSANLTFRNSPATVEWQQLCGAIDEGILRNYSCSERKPFMCYKNDNYTLVENKKDWCQALQHCRTHYSGMVSNSTITQNNKVTETGTVRIKVIEERLPWEQAYDYCKANHTDMLWIEDLDDQEAVEQWLNYTDVAGPFWIGLRQSRVFGTWIWASDKLVTYSNWSGGNQPELPLSNHCGVIHKVNNTWSDENCWVPLSFLCEEEIVYM